MAKFGRWPQWLDMARDLKRGLYQLTFKDNLPSEPVIKSWTPEIKGLAISPTLGAGYMQRVVSSQYWLLGKVMSFHIICQILIAEDSTYFYLKLPAPAAELEANEWEFWFTFTSGMDPDDPFLTDPTATQQRGVAVVTPGVWWVRFRRFPILAGGVSSRGEDWTGNRSIRLHWSGSYVANNRWYLSGKLPDDTPEALFV